MQTYEDCTSLRLIGSEEVAELAIDVECLCDVRDSGTTELSNRRPATSDRYVP